MAYLSCAATRAETKLSVFLSWWNLLIAVLISELQARGTAAPWAIEETIFFSLKSFMAFCWYALKPSGETSVRAGIALDLVEGGLSVLGTHEPQPVLGGLRILGAGGQGERVGQEPVDVLLAG